MLSPLEKKFYKQKELKALSIKNEMLACEHNITLQMGGEGINFIRNRDRGTDRDTVYSLKTNENK